MQTRPAILTQRYIFRFWLPLALMWLMMAIEQPVLTGAIARMEDAKLELAAFGVTFALALLIESPVIMLLAASTALAKGRQSYGLLLRFTHLLSGSVTILHAVIALTPIYGFLVGTVIGAPEELVEPSRLAFLFLTPWSAAVAYRRLWQGVMIRYGLTDQVGLTTVLRLIASGAVVAVGLATDILPGAALAGLALSVGVIVGAAAAWVWARPILHGPLQKDEPKDQQINTRELLDFYIPLALTNFINFVGRPLITFGLSRALFPLESLALFPVLMSLGFLWRSVGFAYQEVVIALLENEASFFALRRFAITIGIILSGLLLFMALTPVNDFWYGQVSGLTPDLVNLSRLPTILISLSPGAAFIIAWQRGVLVNIKRTRPITIAVALNVLVLVLVMWVGTLLPSVPGIVIAGVAFLLSVVVEMLFLTTQTRTVSQQFTQLKTAPA